jgi:hypothetical protein
MERPERVARALVIAISVGAIVVLWTVVEGRRPIVSLLSVWIAFVAYRVWRRGGSAEAD